MSPRPKKVLIAGGGVAALEAALALRALAELVSVELLGPEPHFWYRPLSVAEPFGLGEAQRFELGELALAVGATFTPGTLLGVDAAEHVARTSVGNIDYAALLVAVGAVPTPALPAALTFRGPADTDKIRDLLGELTGGAAGSVAFVAPGGAAWSLPIYELALMTAAHLEAREVSGVDLLVVTHEEEPLRLFGEAGRRAVRALLESHSIDVRAASYPSEFVEGELRLVPNGRIAVDRVVSLPRLVGPKLDGLPQTVDGFIPIDSHMRVRGLEDVYVAGDVASFPVKQGGIAAQMADVAARAIAAELGADVEVEPFRPVLRGLLLTGGRPQYLRHELTAAGQVDAASPEPLWWPPAKVVGRYLAPFLAERAGAESVPESAVLSGAVEVHVELGEDSLLGYRQAGHETRMKSLGLGF